LGDFGWLIVESWLNCNVNSMDNDYLVGRGGNTGNMFQRPVNAVESCEARIFNQICSAMDIRLREIAASIEQRMQAQQDEAIERVVEAAEGRSSNHSEALRLVNELITTRVSNVSAELSVNLDTRVAALADAQNDRVQDVGHALEVKLEKWEAQQRETIRLLRDNLRDVDAKTGTMMMRMDALALAVESAQLKVASHASQQSDTTLAQTHAQFQVDELVTELQSQKERTAASMVAIHSSLRTLEDRLNIGSANAVREIREAETRCTAVLQTCRDLLARAKGTAEAAVGTVVAPHEERLRYELVCNANSAAQQAVTSVKQGCEVLISPRQDATVITNAGVVHRHNIFANSTPQASRSLPQPQPRTATPRVANPGQVTRLQSARAIATAEQERRADERAQALSEAAALRRRNRK